MKTRLIATLLLFFLILVNVFGQTQPRNDKEIQKLFKMCEVSNKNILSQGPADPRKWNKMAHGKEVSLKDNIKSEKIKSEELNDIEKALLDSFDDVILSNKVPNAYFVIDKSDNVRIGLFSLDGKMQVPPVYGCIRYITSFNCIMVGDTGDWSEYEDYFNYRIGKASRSCAGCFMAVINSNTMTPDIPFKINQRIYFTLKGLHRYFYVEHINDDSNNTWGAYDKNGNILVVPKYKSVTLKNKEFVGDDSRTMADVLKEANRSLAKHKYNRENRAVILGQSTLKVLKNIGEGLLQFGEFIVDSGICDVILDMASNLAGDYSSSSSSYSNLSNSYQQSFSSATDNQGSNRDYLQEYNKWKQHAENAYNSLTKVSISASDYQARKKLLRQAQQMMIKIRQEALNHGITIKPSEMETAQVTL